MKLPCRLSWNTVSVFWIFPGSWPRRWTAITARTESRGASNVCWARTRGRAPWPKKSVKGVEPEMLGVIRDLIAWTPMELPAFLFVITLVVFFHELGHFLVARYFGVKVDVFSVGFGKEIFGWNDRRGTRWKLSWIPVGGYVKFAGDADASSRPDTEATAKMTASEKEGTLALKPVGQRALVAASGPLANFVLAIVMLTGIFLYTGHAEVTPVVGTVKAGMPAAAAGILPGDRVTSIDGTKITDFQQLPEIISIATGDPLAFGIQRGGKNLVIWVTPKRLA